MRGNALVADYTRRSFHRFPASTACTNPRLAPILSSVDDDGNDVIYFYESLRNSVFLPRKGFKGSAFLDRPLIMTEKTMSRQVYLIKISTPLGLMLTVLFNALVIPECEPLFLVLIYICQPSIGKEEYGRSPTIRLWLCLPWPLLQQVKSCSSHFTVGARSLSQWISSPSQDA